MNVIWVVELLDKEKNKPEITTFGKDGDLGIFLQNYDKDKFQVMSVRELLVDEISTSEKFIKKDLMLLYLAFQQFRKKLGFAEQKLAVLI